MYSVKPPTMSDYDIAIYNAHNEELMKIWEQIDTLERLFWYCKKHGIPMWMRRRPVNAGFKSTSYMLAHYR